MCNISQLIRKFIKWLVKTLWNDEDNVPGMGNHNQRTPDHDYNDLKSKIIEIEKVVNRIQRKVYRDISKGDGDYTEADDTGWIKSVK